METIVDLEKGFFLVDSHSYFGWSCMLLFEFGQLTKTVLVDDLLLFWCMFFLERLGFILSHTHAPIGCLVECNISSSDMPWVITIQLIGQSDSIQEFMLRGNSFCMVGIRFAINSIHHCWCIKDLACVRTYLHAGREITHFVRELMCVYIWGFLSFVSVCVRSHHHSLIMITRT
jgi:hypothetical protein